MTVRVSVAAALIFALLAGCGQLENRENYYANYGAAEAGGAIAQGLLPATLPKSAQRIQASQRDQGKSLLVMFLYDPRDAPMMVAQCERVLETQASALQLPQLHAEWWPHELKSKDYFPPGYEYYHCSGDHGFLALNTKQALAYFWRG